MLNKYLLLEPIAHQLLYQINHSNHNISSSRIKFGLEMCIFLGTLLLLSFHFVESIIPSKFAFHKESQHLNFHPFMQYGRLNDSRNLLILLMTFHPRLVQNLPPQKAFAWLLCQRTLDLRYSCNLSNHFFQQLSIIWTPDCNV